jgi:hypothetical protein
MSELPRIARLRALVVELQESTPSPERDALLREIGTRLATLETGAPRSVVDAWQRRRAPASAAQRLTSSLLDA